jgi:hypothetical protein
MSHDWELWVLEYNEMCTFVYLLTLKLPKYFYSEGKEVS